VRLEKRFSSGLQFLVTYVFSKAIDNASATDGNIDWRGDAKSHLQDPNNYQIERAVSPYDSTHVLQITHVYELPFGPGKRFLNGGGLPGKLFGGWQISTIATVRTGRPISFIAGSCTPGNCTGAQTVYRGTVNRSARSNNNTVNTTLTLSQLQNMTGLFRDPRTGLPLLVDPSLIGSDGRANPAFFTNPTAGTFGGLSLTPVDGPGYWSADMAFIKRTKFKENLNLELRLEAFNVFNHPNLQPPFDTNLMFNANGTPILTAGKINFTSTDARQIQFGLKVVW